MQPNHDPSVNLSTHVRLCVVLDTNVYIGALVIHAKDKLKEEKRAQK